MSRPQSFVEGLEPRRLLDGVVALGELNRIYQVNTDNPTRIFKNFAIRNLNAGDVVVGIDYRPASGELYGLVNGTSTDRIIKINPSSGRSSTTFTLTTALDGTEFGVDFNPAADALRVTSNTGQNLRIPFATGLTFADTPLAYNANDINGGATPNIVASAYTNSFPGTTATVLYNIDATLDQLVIQNPPNAGTLVSRGPLGVAIEPTGVGFDIQPSLSLAGATNKAYLSATRSAPATDGGTRLYSIDLRTGGALDVGLIGGADDPRIARSIALVPVGDSERAAQRRIAALAAVRSENPFNRESTIQRDGIL